MSFKRDGNDDRWLSMLTKRRVAELLSEDIPEDEACIIKNGRLACLVCGHRPTFDTSEMLRIHRNGKKHIANHALFQNRKQELQELKDKRWVEKYGETGMNSLDGQSSNVSSFLKTQAYNPRAKKRLKPNERRTVLQIGQDLPRTEDTTATSTASLPGYQKLTATQRSASLTPSFKNAQKDMTIQKSTKNDGPLLSIGPIKSSSARQVLPQTISEYVKLNSVRQRALEIRPYSKKSEESSCDIDNSDQGSHCPPVKCQKISEPEKESVKKTKTKIKKEVLPTGTVNEESIRKKQLYLQATSSGWKLDWTGQKWVKDSDVEFDSDEEPPELPF